MRCRLKGLSLDLRLIHDWLMRRNVSSSRLDMFINILGDRMAFF